MFTIYDLRQYAEPSKKQAQKKEIAMDAVEQKVKEDVKKPQPKADKNNIQADPADNGAKIANFQVKQIQSEALSLLQEWLGTTDEDLDQDEGMGDRLMALLIGLADENKDGEISDDEAEIIDIGMDAIAQYLSSKGVSDDNIDALLSDFDNDLAEDVHSMVLEALPEGDDAVTDEMDNVVFTADDNGDIFDSVEVALDAAYKKVFAIRGGKKVRVMKRISGKVRLSAKQKQAIRKAQLKAHTGAAKIKRLKSLRMRNRLGL